MKKTVYALILLWAGTADAGGPDVAPVAQAPAATVENLFYCPPIAALTKNPDTNTWTATVGWKSYDLSFVDKLTQFAGAQWRGTNVGQIFCVYRSDVDTDFPVLLAYKILSFRPEGGKWSGDLGGYTNCESPLQTDCPFSIRTQPTGVDMYQQAEKLKSTAPQAPKFGF